MKTILVTEKEYAKASDILVACHDLRVLASPFEETELAAMVRNEQARCVIVGVERYFGPLYEALHDVGEKYGGSVSYGSLIARFGVGHDGIDKTSAERYGIAVTNTPGVLSRSVAEHAFWLIGALLRNVVKGDKAMQNGEFPAFTGFELYEKTLLVVGIGEIGRQVAKIARFGFGMQVVAFDCFSIDELAERSKTTPEQFLDENGIGLYTTDLDSVLPEADVVSLHLASTPQTRHFVSKRRLESMKPSAVLINTARGPVVDESALFNALSSGTIAGAGLDVFETEPYRPVDPSVDLRTLSNVVLTPHLGSSSVEANRRMAESALNNVRLFFEGRFDEMNLVQR